MINEVIKVMREERKLSQKDVAEKAEISTKTLMNWESGKTEPKVSELIKLGRIFGVPIGIMAGEEPENNNVLLSSIKKAINTLENKELEALSIILESLFLRNQSNKNKFDLVKKTT